MSTFVIFVIVLTLGYILYYAALITIDMTAKQKSDAATEETIDADGYSEDDADDDVVPRNVIENTETGGFSFSPSVPVIEEPAEIDEADEEEPLSAQTEDVDGNTVEDAAEEDTAEASEEPSDVPAEEEQETDEQVSEEEAPVEKPSEQTTEDEPVSGIEYYQEKPEDDTDKNDFDVNDAFVISRPMMKSPTTKHIPFGVFLSLLSMTVCQTASAKSGAVDYSWGADGLAEATSFVGTMMIYTVDILYAVAAIMVIVSALQIYIKMNNHEGDITKSILMLAGGILFMIGAMIVMPAFFGYQNMNFIF